MPLTSSSTLADIDNEIVANIHYAANGSATQARAYREALTWWLLRHPSKSANAGAEVSIKDDWIQDQLRAVEAWISDNAGTLVNGGVTHYGFAGFRD